MATDGWNSDANNKAHLPRVFKSISIGKPWEPQERNGQITCVWFRFEDESLERAKNLTNRFQIEKQLEILN